MSESKTQEAGISFASLDLPEQLRAGIRKTGFTHCTPIQGQTLPIALSGKDVAGQAQTGTGKTAAFLIATFSHLLRNALPADQATTKNPRAVILAPTRELALQIHSDCGALGAATGLRCQVVFGGADYDKQRDKLQAGVDVLIGTPGRFIDYLKQGVFNLNSVQVMVLDEADRMFDLGFIKDIRYVMRRLPRADMRLNLLFSATLNQKVLELAYEHMNDPVSVSIEPEKVTADKVIQAVYFPGNHEKQRLLVNLLRQVDAQRTMVFVNMKHQAEKVAALLSANGFSASAISGDVPQNKRMRMLESFQSGKLAILIATDVASRGLHIDGVTHVVNYDLPQDCEDYVHRIGRTARAGASGDAISFACESYAMTMPDIEKYIGFSIPVKPITPELLAEVTVPKMPPRKRSGASKGGAGGRGRPHSGGGQHRRR
ncbi:MAG: DEAD/DEAH box helicase [Gammaproteobacteria bacterium]|jgi:ATP-dependent RNA helicase RhlB|nr:DEAD/DEAH box helicase [Gammaproteobacteria bacterium]